MRRAWAATGAGFALALGAVLGAVLGAAQAASAHDQLVDATPAGGTTASSVDVVTLVYSSALLGASDETANLAQVVGPDGRHYETACASVTGAEMAVPVDLGPSGDYTVSWRVVSSDGHPVSGDYSFSYAPDAGAEAASGTTSSPCAAVAASAADDTDSGTAGDSAAGPDETTAGAVAGLSAGAVVLGILVIVVMVGVQARKKKSDPGS